MNYPHGLTEAEVLKALDSAVAMLAPSFAFGYFTEEDISQEGYIFGLAALEKYDPRPGPDGKPTRPLANFLYSVIRSRLINLKRNLFHRCDPPCALCHAGRQSEHADGEVCKKYKRWAKTNNSKASLARPQDMENVPDDAVRSADLVADEAGASEMRALIDRELPCELRPDYLRMLAGEKGLPKARRQKVADAIREIVWRNEEGAA